MPTAQIVGGGIAGCAAALALAQTGWKTQLIEQRSGPAQEGAGIQISPNARHALDAIGVNVLPDLAFPKRIEIHAGQRPTPLSSYKLGSDYTHGFGKEYAVMTRSALQLRLWEACQQHANIDIQAGHGTQLDLNADLIVGADGIASITRNSILSANGASSSGYVACRAVVQMDDSQARDIPKDVVSLWLGAGSHGVIYPLPDRQLNIVMSTKGKIASSGWSAQASDELVGSILCQLSPKLGSLRSAARFSQWDIQQVPPGGSWHDDKTVLIGDAAHAMPPFAAQGAAMALEDAVVLAAELTRSSSISSGLAAYERARRPRINQIAKLSTSNARLYHMSGPLAVGRNVALQATPQSVVNARMGWVYSWMPPELSAS
ncbi:MAG: NAD(P)/FAD-dependent oxidoreductase [Pseudomonadota bacterium]